MWVFWVGTFFWFVRCHGTCTLWDLVVEVDGVLGMRDIHRLDEYCAASVK